MIYAEHRVDSINATIIVILINFIIRMLENSSSGTREVPELLIA